MDHIFTSTEEIFLKLLPFHEAEEIRHTGMGPNLRALLAAVDEANAKVRAEMKEIWRKQYPNRYLDEL